MIKHTALSAIQRIPFYSAAAGTILCTILSLTDGMTAEISRFVFEAGVISAGFFIIYIFSVYLGFCKFQRLGIYYTYIVFLCVWGRRYFEGSSGLFGGHIHIAHVLMSSLGILYLSLFLYKQFHRCNNCPHKNRRASDSSIPT